MADPLCWLLYAKQGLLCNMTHGHEPTAVDAVDPCDVIARSS